MIDIHDAELDARITKQELCEHKNPNYQPTEYHETDVGIGILTNISIHESYTCDDCGTELDIPEPDWDLMREGKWLTINNYRLAIRGVRDE